MRYIIALKRFQVGTAKNAPPLMYPPERYCCLDTQVGVGKEIWDRFAHIPTLPKDAPELHRFQEAINIHLRQVFLYEDTFPRVVQITVDNRYLPLETDTGLKFLIVYGVEK